MARKPRTAETLVSIKPTEPLRPLLPIEEMKNLWIQFQELKSRLLTKEDHQTIAGKEYIKKSGWRKLAVAFGLSDQILGKTREEREDGSIVWEFHVRVTAPNGRYAEAVARCDSRERSFAHPEHDVEAVAHTRAKNRAISDLVAGGEVSAEEIFAER